MVDPVDKAIDDTYGKGELAHQLGEPRSANPYTLETLRRVWNEGWQREEDKRQKERTQR